MRIGALAKRAPDSVFLLVVARFADNNFDPNNRTSPYQLSVRNGTIGRSALLYTFAGGFDAHP